MAKKISLDRFAKGALAEIFNAEMARVMTNICDVNTKATSTRKVTLTLEIKGNENRDLGEVTIAGKSTLAPRSSVKTTVTIGYDKEAAQGECQELNAEMVGQMDLAEIEREWIAEQNDAIAADFTKNTREAM